MTTFLKTMASINNLIAIYFLFDHKYEFAAFFLAEAFFLQYVGRDEPKAAKTP